MQFVEQFLARFESFLLENNLIHQRDKLIVGFSGGPDSTALIEALRLLRPKYKLFLLAVHINYGLRGEDSDNDEKFVKDYCFKNAVNIVVKKAKITDKANLENTARKIRFEQFNRLLKVYKINRIALGHTKDDQAETLLLRMGRGSAISGMKGIEVKSGNVIHPLLIFTKKEIKRFLAELNQEYCTDQSNFKNDFDRNKVRNVLLPCMEENLSHKIVDKLYDMSLIFQDADEIFREMTNSRLHRLTDDSEEEFHSLDLRDLLKQKRLIRFYIYRQLYCEFTGHENDFYTSHYEAIEEVIHSKGCKELNLPSDVIVRKDYKNLIFTTKEKIEEYEPQERIIDSVRNRFTFENYRVSMKKFRVMPKKKNQFEDKNTAYFDYDKLELPLMFRHRVPGDKFIPFGMKHHKKLKDFFIDEKVSKFDRDKVIVLTDNNNIIWICGKRIDNRVVITDETKNILMIKLEKIISGRPRSAERKK